MGTVTAVLAPLCIVCMIIPTVVCLVSTGGVHSFFTLAGESECSDPLTSQSMIDLGSSSKDVLNENYQTLFVDIAMLLYAIFFAVWKVRMFKKRTPGPPRRSQVLMVQGPQPMNPQLQYQQPMPQQSQHQMAECPTAPPPFNPNALLYLGEPMQTQYGNQQVAHSAAIQLTSLEPDGLNGYGPDNYQKKETSPAYDQAEGAVSETAKLKMQ